MKVSSRISGAKSIGGIENRRVQSTEAFARKRLKGSCRYDRHLSQRRADRRYRVARLAHHVGSCGCLRRHHGPRSRAGTDGMDDHAVRLAGDGRIRADRNLAPITTIEIQPVSRHREPIGRLVPR